MKIDEEDSEDDTSIKKGRDTEDPDKKMKELERKLKKMQKENEKLRKTGGDRSSSSCWTIF